MDERYIIPKAKMVDVPVLTPTIFEPEPPIMASETVEEIVEELQSIVKMQSHVIDELTIQLGQKEEKEI